MRQMTIDDLADHVKYPSIDFDVVEFLKPISEMNEGMYHVVMNNRIGCFNDTDFRHMSKWDLSMIA